MKRNLYHWLPRFLSIAVLLSWATVMTLAATTQYLIILVLVTSVLVLTCLISWKNPAIGGSLFIVLGSGYLIFAMGNFFTLAYIIAVFPLYLMGALFIIDHLNQEKEEARLEDDF